MSENRASATSGGLVSTERRDTYPYIDPKKANLEGKNVLITGASKGLGKAVAISYAQAGASGIALGARSSLELVVKEVLQAAKDAGHPEPQISAVSLDVTSRESVDAAAKQVSQDLDGRIDIVVNNAGYAPEITKIQDVDPDDWWRTWEINVKGPYLIFRAFYPLLIKSSLKILINVVSVGALMTLPLSSAYGPSKLATLRVTEQINQDNGEGKDGILAIAVHPGGVMTDMGKALPEKLHVHLVDTAQLSGDTIAWLGVERREWLGGRYVSANWDMEELSTKKGEIVQRDLLKMRLAV